MGRITKKFIALVLVISMMLATVPVSALASSSEEYLADLRLVYADKYEDAVSIVASSMFDDYEVLNYNLNNKSGKTGTWLAYKTTDDIELAITDIAVMQMQGGYQEGNYQAMLAQSRSEYEIMSQLYCDAIDYFVEAYESGDFLADCAFRQLNFFCDNDDHNGDLLGDIFVTGIDPAELATIFMQGNVHAIKNIRSLIAMGCAYNDSGEHYLEIVGSMAAEMNDDPEVFADEDYDEDALIIAGSMITFRDMFEELATEEADFDFSDGNFTDKELYYAEYKAIADRFRDVEYLGEQTLYDFTLAYELDEEDLSSLYPLVAAMNKGQTALNKLGHFYDVVRYSMSEYPEEMLDEEISRQEETYSVMPFDIYSGVDRSIFVGTFALTSEAYREDASTGSGFLSHILDDGAWVKTALTGAGVVIGTGLMVWAALRTKSHIAANHAISAAASAESAKAAAQAALDSYVFNANAEVAAKSAEALVEYGFSASDSYGQIVDGILSKLFANTEFANTVMNMGFDMKVMALNVQSSQLTTAEAAAVKLINTDVIKTQIATKKAAQNALDEAVKNTAEVAGNAAGVSTGAIVLTTAMYALSAVLLVLSAYNIGVTIKNYLHPEYDDIPTALVDLIVTDDGDRYIKYDVVFDVEDEESAADLNAFSGERWNALYYTTSYEAGKPLLAEFNISTDNNTPKEGYAPVHRFGEVVSYNVNRYHRTSSAESIYLSVKQSDKNKSAVEGVPELVGSMLSFGYTFLAAGLGAAAGAGITLGVQSKAGSKKRNKED